MRSSRRKWVVPLTALLLSLLIAVSGLRAEEPAEQERSADRMVQLCDEAVEMDGILKSPRYDELTEAQKEDFFIRAWEIAVELKDLGYPSDICDRRASAESESSP